MRATPPPMHLELVPLLRVERELYETPRGFVRFRAYLKAMQGGSDDVDLLPLVALNPMGKEHVAAVLDVLLALDAEAVAADAIASAARRLRGVAGSFKVGLVVSDDAQGGWTQRQLTDARQRFELDAALKRGWITVLLWSSETPSREAVRRQTLAAIYRACYVLRHGEPRTLGQMLQQEGLAAAFAEQPPPGLAPDELAAIRAVIDPRRDETAYPVLIAALYGDAAARTVGYPPLGLPENAGFTLALHEALQLGVAPEAALLGDARRASSG
ncbi:MAG TPA: hypothetical protein VFD32_22750 [Dehalococcoidia bacterium]|nr:hypothetical protein [Dehalococcoidia bacterium]